MPNAPTRPRRPTARSGVNLEGGEELLKRLAALGGDVKKAVRGATRAGAKVMQTAAETNARAVSGQSGKHTRILSSARKATSVEFRIGPTKKKFFMQFFEVGVMPHEITGAPLVFEGANGLVVIGGVHHPGMPAQPWLRPAFDATREPAIAAVGEALRQAIEEQRIIAEGQDDAEE